MELIAGPSCIQILSNVAQQTTQSCNFFFLFWRSEFIQIYTAKDKKTHSLCYSLTISVDHTLSLVAIYNVFDSLSLKSDFFGNVNIIIASSCSHPTTNRFAYITNKQKKNC